MTIWSPPFICMRRTRRLDRIGSNILTRNKYNSTPSFIYLLLLVRRRVRLYKSCIFDMQSGWDRCPTTVFWHILKVLTICVCLFVTSFGFVYRHLRTMSKNIYWRHRITSSLIRFYCTSYMIYLTVIIVVVVISFSYRNANKQTHSQRSAKIIQRTRQIH